MRRSSRGPVWYERLKNFFQRLSQAVASSQRSCLVVSLLATEPSKVDEVGREILAQCNNGLGRVAQDRSPVEKNDLPELLRRRLFSSYPETEADKQQHVLAFWPRFEAMDPTRAKQPAAMKKLVEAYPFHPDMLDRFFGKWTGVREFQRTRGVLQTFANALREAEPWDESPLISTQVLLPAPGPRHEHRAAKTREHRTAIQRRAERRLLAGAQDRTAARGRGAKERNADALGPGDRVRVCRSIHLFAAARSKRAGGTTRTALAARCRVRHASADQSRPERLGEGVVVSRRVREEGSGHERANVLAARATPES